MSLQGKRLAILGGNQETGHLIRVANDLGIHTIVVDPNPAAPAKAFGRERREVNVLDLDAVTAVLQAARVDGVLVGVADPLVESYHHICRRLGVRCYVPPAAIPALTRKDAFARLCQAFGIDTTPGLAVPLAASEAELAALPYPVIVKPVDGGAGVGMMVCHSPEELRAGMAHARRHSRADVVQVERYMTCDDLLAYYTFHEGVARLSAVADRFTTRGDGRGSPVCVRAEYPSRHLQPFLDEVDPRLRAMFAHLGVRDGVLNIQFFREGDRFYAYDPGFRLQGEAPHLYLAHLFGIDNREFLVHFALGATPASAAGIDRIDAAFGGGHACTLWVLLRAGRIARLEGMDTIARLPGVIAVMQRLSTGDVILEEHVGTERQVLARVYLASPRSADIAAALATIAGLLRVDDAAGASLIVNDLAAYSHA
jgi:biotin carboxylase